MASTKTEEVAVREYLLYIEDPAQLVDQKLVSQLEQRLAAATDPLDRLKAIAEHERAIHPNEGPYRSAFIAHARDWAAANDVTAAAFERIGVDRQVLIDAGLAKPIQPKNRKPSLQPAPAIVTVAHIKATIEQLSETFTLADIAQTAGGSPMTIRKAISELVESGQVRRLGPAANWTNKGRAPVIYERTRATSR